MQQLTDPNHAQIFRDYRMGIIHQDLPGLRPGVVAAGAAQIATGLADLTAETRQSRLAEEQRRLADTNKSPSTGTHCQPD